MNIHEHQAKQILKQFGAVVPEGVYGFTVEELLEKCKSLKTDKYVLKAQIHAGGRGKAGGVKILDNLNDLEKSAKELFGKKLVTHQTGPEGREVKRLYVEVSSNIEKEFYLSCLVDRASSKIAFISSDQGGMDIEEVAIKSPDKILTNKIELTDEISDEWAVSQVRACVDYSHDNYLTTFFCGALNYQVTHHLFPTVSQYHYPAIAKIIKEVCKEYDVEYKVLPDFKSAFYAHVKHLYNLGQDGVAAEVHMG